MPKLMKSINNISRCQAAYRAAKVVGTPAEELSPCYHAIIIAVCKYPGRSQEELARELCLDKSTITRAISHLEDNGFVVRESNPNDKRSLLVYPTEKMKNALPTVRAISAEWNRLISLEISEEEFEVFCSVLYRLEDGAKGVIKDMERRRG
jgi:DNA-binding MarR family transcriptional regulator